MTLSARLQHVLLAALAIKLKEIIRSLSIMEGLFAVEEFNVHKLSGRNRLAIRHALQTRARLLLLRQAYFAVGYILMQFTACYHRYKW